MGILSKLFTWWDGATLTTAWHLRRHGRKVGSDSAGNVYYASKKGRHAFRVEVARSEAEQAKGLMFRTAMGANEGMLFPRTPPDIASFWMHNTVIPLDIVFIGLDHRIINIAANAVPYDETPLSAAGTTLAVLELNGGRAAELGIAPGDRVEW